MATSIEIAEFLDQELKVKNFEDGCNNGLQVENTGEIKKIGFAVDACLETFQQAVEAGCQMLITHHGWLWEGRGRFYLNGQDYKKAKMLMEDNLALYCAHLPLDAHEEYGNNNILAKMLKLKNLKPFGINNGQTIGYCGETDTSIKEIKKILTETKHQTLFLPFGPEKIKKVAILSGSGGGELKEAIEQNMDLYLTGEGKHNNYHQAKEANINVIFGGHYETEVWGVKALMPVLKDKFKVKVEFIDVPTLI
jgi:dinuclear metal center YbgI/SA1388 family protein